jgi:hypothetical protein
MKKVLSNDEVVKQQAVRQEYLNWCLGMLEIHKAARKGYHNFIQHNDLGFYDKPRFKAKAWIPYNEVKIMAEMKGISIQEARQLRNDFNNWIGAIRWSDPEKTTQKLAKIGLQQCLN